MNEILGVGAMLIIIATGLGLGWGIKYALREAFKNIKKDLKIVEK